MSADPLLGEIQVFGFSFAPRGWSECNGQLLQISQNTSLFALLGTDYGGDGFSSFALPNLQGRTMVHAGHGTGLTPVRIGEKGGRDVSVLTVANMPAHSHTATLHAEDGVGDKPGPLGRMLARGSGNEKIFRDPDPADNKEMAPDSISVSSTGEGTPIDNRGPYLGVNICIAMTGVFPSRS